MSRLVMQVAGLAVATAVVLPPTTSLSAPVPSSTTVLTQAASAPTPVYYRGRGWAAAGVGFAAGAILGSALAAPRYGYYSAYGAPYAYGQPYYGARVYAAPGYRGYPACDYVDSSGVTSFDNC